MTEPDPEPRPPDGHGAIPEDHPILVDLKRAGDTVRRINRSTRDQEQ